MFSEIIYINLTKQKKNLKHLSISLILISGFIEKHALYQIFWIHKQPLKHSLKTIPQCPSNGWINYAKLFSKQRMTTFYDFLEMQMWVPEYINIVVEDFVALFVTMHTT